MRISGLQASNPHHGRMGIEQSETAMWPGCMELLMPRPPEYLSALPAGTAAIINLTPHTAVAVGAHVPANPQGRTPFTQGAARHIRSAPAGRGRHPAAQPNPNNAMCACPPTAQPHNGARSRELAAA